ncbi:MAG: hypothetical protein OHK0039_01400 [Bacteroidia bacterium]
MIFQLHITLERSHDPVVWRRIQIDSGSDFNDLHGAIQASFGWQSSHLYLFIKPNAPKPGTRLIGLDEHWQGDMDNLEEASELPLEAIFKAVQQQIQYVYDMGDNWEHIVLLEEMQPGMLESPRCLAGEGACPPEDCGGIPGYYELVEAVNTPTHPQHRSQRKWLGLRAGDRWDVHAFDLAAAQRALDEAFE